MAAFSKSLPQKDKAAIEKAKSNPNNMLGFVLTQKTTC
jgi:hypothetical protein